MARTPDVIPGEPVESAWGNEIRDRTIQRFADATERDLEIPIPADGDAAFLEDTGQMMLYADGSWGNVLAASDGSAGAPSHSFTSDPESGMFLNTDADVRISAGGIGIAQFLGDGLDNRLRSFWPILLDAGTVEAPALAFAASTNLGLYRIAANIIGLAAGNAGVAYWDPNGTHCVAMLSSGSAPNVYSQENQSGRLYRSTAILAATDAPGVASMDARTGLTSGDSIDLLALVDHLLDRIETLEAAI